MGRFDSILAAAEDLLPKQSIPERAELAYHKVWSKTLFQLCFTKAIWHANKLADLMVSFYLLQHKRFFTYKNDNSKFLSNIKFSPSIYCFSCCVN